MPQDEEEEEEDYMSMIIEEPKQKETFTQKKLRQQREVSFSFFTTYIYISQVLCTTNQYN